MNYHELKKIINELNEYELNQTVTAYINLDDEFVPVTSVLIAESNQDILDAGHVYFSV